MRVERTSTVDGSLRAFCRFIEKVPEQVPQATSVTMLDVAITPRRPVTGERMVDPDADGEDQVTWRIFWMRSEPDVLYAARSKEGISVRCTLSKVLEALEAESMPPPCPMAPRENA